MKVREALLKLSILIVALGVAAPPVLSAKPQADGNRLTAQAKSIARQQLARFGPGYTARIDPTRNLVFISALDETHLRETVRLLAAFTDAFRKTLLTTRAKWNIVVILPTADDYSKLAPAENVKGFYQGKDHTLISVDRGRVLLHEFTHALHHADFAAANQLHPIWICEGFATLAESGRITPDGYAPTVDIRLLTLQDAIRKNTCTPLEKLVKLDQQRFLRNADVHYPQVRYLMLYLHRQGKLVQWYKTYKETYAADRSGRKAIQKVLSKPLYLIEDNWKKWVADLELPWGETQSYQGRLGLEFQDCSRGVKVVGMVSGRAAAKAGRIKIGDIIARFNGHVITNSAHLVAAIRSAGANQTVTVEIVRHGRKLTILQPLGSSAGR